MEFICQRMNDECDGGNTPINTFKVSKPKIGGRNIFGESNIMFLLVKDRQLCSSALLMGSCQIAFRWTPPSQRRKGYAGAILKLIEEAWRRTTTVVPLWVCSSPHMFKSNERNGWVKTCGLPEGDLPNVDGSQDYFPAWAADRYRARWEKQIAKNQDLSGVFKDFIITNKNPNSEDEQDYERFLSQFKPFEMRKMAQKVRV
jgi:hypothetical protein